MAKAEATVEELVSKIWHSGLRLRSTWAKQADIAVQALETVASQPSSGGLGR